MNKKDEILTIGIKSGGYMSKEVFNVLVPEKPYRRKLRYEMKKEGYIKQINQSIKITKKGYNKLNVPMPNNNNSEALIKRCELKSVTYINMILAQIPIVDITKEYGYIPSEEIKDKEYNASRCQGILKAERVYMVYNFGEANSKFTERIEMRFKVRLQTILRRQGNPKEEIYAIVFVNKIEQIKELVENKAKNKLRPNTNFAGIYVCENKNPEMLKDVLKGEGIELYAEKIKKN